MKFLPLFFLVIAVFFAFNSCNKDEDDKDNTGPDLQETWELDVTINITDPQPSTFPITSTLDVVVDGEEVTFTGDYQNGNLLFEEIVFHGELDGTTVTMLNNQIEVSYIFQGTTYTEFIEWEMEPFDVIGNQTSGGGTISAHKMPDDITESGTFTFTGVRVEE